MPPGAPMAIKAWHSKALPSVYPVEPILEAPEMFPAGLEARMVSGLAIAMFIALFAWGASYFGWHDPMGKVQLALFTSFILGAVCGFKSKS